MISRTTKGSSREKIPPRFRSFPLPGFGGIQRPFQVAIGDYANEPAIFEHEQVTNTALPKQLHGTLHRIVRSNSDELATHQLRNFHRNFFQ